jgi:hypothetical protein
MTDTLKKFRFSDEQIDQLLRLVRNKAFQVNYNPQPEDEDYDYYELADLIYVQIINHPTNP